MRNIVSPLDGIRSPFGRRLGTTFTPLSLFAANEPGVWYDPSDLSTMFQDAAGTTPVTAVEQPVGLRLDKSGNGNHAKQTTDINRPVLSARYNLLTYTEDVSNAAWEKTNLTASNATLLLETTTNAMHNAIQRPTFVSGVQYTIRYRVKPNGRTRVSVGGGSGLGGLASTGQFYDLTGSGSVVNTLSGISASITADADGYYTCSLTITPSSSGAIAVGIYLSDGGTNLSYFGDTSKGVYLTQADVRVSNDGVGLPAHQRVTTATDYDTTGFPYYLRYNGTNSTMQTPSIDFSSTDAVSVFAGIRKLSDAARGTVAELTASVAANNGGFHLTAPNAASATYAFESKGTALTDAVVSTGVVAPITSLLTGLADISADSNILRVNGAQADSDTGDQGTGNYANAALYLGARGGSSGWFQGRDYGICVLGRTATAAEIASMEAWMNSKAKAY